MPGNRFKASKKTYWVSKQEEMEELDCKKIGDCLMSYQKIYRILQEKEKKH